MGKIQPHIENIPWEYFERDKETSRYSRMALGAREIIEKQVRRRQSLKISERKLAKHLAPYWRIGIPAAQTRIYEKAEDPRNFAWSQGYKFDDMESYFSSQRKEKIYKTILSDYLSAIGLSEDEAKELFLELEKFTDSFEYIPSIVSPHPKINEQKEKREEKLEERMSELLAIAEWA